MNNKFIIILKQIVAVAFKILFITMKEIGNLLGELKDRFIEKLRFSLTFKITAAYIFITSSILMLFSTVIICGFIAYSGWNAETNLQKNHRLISEYLRDYPGIPEDKLNSLSNIVNITISIFDENRTLLYTSEEDKASIVFYDKDSNRQAANLNGDFLIVNDLNNRYMNWSDLEDRNNNFGYALVLNNQEQLQTKSVYIQIKDKLIAEISGLIALALGLLILDNVLLIMVLIEGGRASRKTLRPIQTMTNTVKNITIKELDTRLDIRGSQDELKDLARTFNSMLDRIQQSYEQQNQFVSDASHELRTPISVIQGYANMLDRWGKDDKSVLDESIAAIKSESENMKRLIEKLLFLARSDKNTQKIEKEEFYISELIDEIIKETKLIDSLHEIKSEKNDVTKINADPRLIKEALRVFIDNSIKYTHEGGYIKIDSVLQSNVVLITIEDTGIGIPKEDLPHIFDRFYRADKSRTKQTGGTGLGLAIAKWIILRHNGEIKVDSRVNIGTKIEIILPLV